MGPARRLPSATTASALCGNVTSSMNQIFSQEDIERFHLNGYVRLESAFDRTLTHRVMTYIWEILEQRYGFDREDPSTWNRPTKGLIKILQANRDLWNIGDQKITYAITQLLGPSWKSPTHWGTLLHTMPESPDMWNIPTGWHWDSDPLEIINGKEGLFIFIFMSHVLPQGGGTLILEGAHKLLLRYHRRGVEAKGSSHNTFFKAHPWLVDLRNNTGPMNERVARLMEQNAEIENVKVRVVELTGEPGDAVLCHPLIVHARSQNASKVPRFMLAKRIWRKQA